METYRIVRFYSDGRARRTIKTGLDLDDAQAHCNDPETSSRTAKKGRGGATCDWFDGYEQE